MIEVAICWIFSGSLLVATFYLIRKDREKWLIGTAILLSFLSFLCSLTWFQGVFKTHIISTVYGTLEQYGKKLDEFQETTGKMKAEVAEHQGRLDEHQREIDSQQSRLGTAQVALSTQQNNIAIQQSKLSEMQQQLSSAQVEINEQQKQLSEVEYYVKNVFSKVTFEHFSDRDTNRMVSIKLTNGIHLVFFKLEKAAIPKSASGIQFGGLGPSPISINGYSKNVVWAKWTAPPSGVTIQYVADDRKQSLAKELTVHENQLLIDGSLVADGSKIDINPSADEKRHSQAKQFQAASEPEKPQTGLKP